MPREEQSLSSWGLVPVAQLGCSPNLSIYLGFLLNAFEVYRSGRGISREDGNY